MGFCDDEQYEEFMLAAPLFEEMLVRSGILVRFWFLVSCLEQVTRFTILRIDPVRHWKRSANDLASLDRWDDFVLNQLDYHGRDEAVVGRPDPLISGPPETA